MIHDEPGPATLQRIGVAPIMSPFDEARAEITRWEKEYPEAIHIAMVIDDPNDLEAIVAGAALKPSTAAGLFFAAAQVMCE